MKISTNAASSRIIILDCSVGNRARNGPFSAVVSDCKSEVGGQTASHWIPSGIIFNMLTGAQNRKASSGEARFVWGKRGETSPL
jgi:hypothetical protein